jgi:Tfp pilus assembly protein PilE
MKNTTTTYSIRWTSWRCSHFDETNTTVKKYMAIMTTRRHADILDFSSKKVSPDPPPKIRHAATALTGMGCSVAATIETFFVSATPTKSATSIETCLVIRNTGDHEAYDFQDFVAAWRQF